MIMMDLFRKKVTGDYLYSTLKLADVTDGEENFGKYKSGWLPTKVEVWCIPNANP